MTRRLAVLIAGPVIATALIGCWLTHDPKAQQRADLARDWRQQADRNRDAAIRANLSQHSGTATCGLCYGACAGVHA